MGEASRRKRDGRPPKGPPRINPPRPRWNGEPCEARKVVVRVGPSLPGWWCAGLEGQERKAVEVKGKTSTFCLDNEDGQGWHKVTDGMGSPKWGHSSLPPSEVLREDTSPCPGCEAKKK